MEQPKKNLPRDVVLSGADNVRTNFFEGGTAPLKYGIAKTSKIWRNLGQLLTFSEMDRDIDKR